MNVPPSPFAKHYEKWRWTLFLIGPAFIVFFVLSVAEEHRNPTFPTVGSAVRMPDGQLDVTLVSRGEKTEHVLIYVEQDDAIVCLYALYSEQRIDRRLTLDCPELAEGPFEVTTRWAVDDKANWLKATDIR